VRAESAWALGRLGDKRAAETLLTLLREEDWAISTNAAAGLALLDAPEAEQGLRSVLIDGRGAAQANALLALAKLGVELTREDLLLLHRRATSDLMREAVFRVMGKDLERYGDMLRYQQSRARTATHRQVIAQLLGERAVPQSASWVRYVLTDNGSRLSGQRVFVVFSNGLILARESDSSGEIRVEQIPQGETRLVALDSVFKRADVVR